MARKLATETGIKPSWNDVFIAAAEDDRYWDREVRRPALGFLARGKRAHSGADAAEKTFDAKFSEMPRKKGKHNNKDDRFNNGNKHKDKDKHPDRNAGSRPAKGGPVGDKGAHPRKDHKGRFLTTREGTEVCFKFAAGERDACSAPCPHNRAHVCQKCLQPHTNATCSKHA